MMLKQQKSLCVQIQAFISIIALVTFSACTLDEPGTTDNSPALNLEATQNLSLIQLKWDQVKVTGFREYVILQSSSDIPNSPTPEVSQDVVVLARFDDAGVTSFSTANTLFTPNTCYKLYCSVDDRFLYSQSVCVSQQVNLFQGFYDRMAFEQGQAEIVMFDRLNSYLSTYNLESESITNSVQDFNLSFPILDLSTYQNATSVFTFDQNQFRLRKYSFPALNFLTQKTYTEGVLGGVAEGPFVFVSVQNAISAFQILDQNTLALKDSRPGVVSTRNLAVFDGDTMTILEIWENGINKYKINSLGKVIQEDKFVSGVTQVSSQNTCDVSSGYFIGGRFATLVNKEGDVIRSLINGVNAFSFFSRFSPDETKALVIFQDNNIIRLEIHDISLLPATTLLQSYDIPASTYSDLFVKDEVIHVMGVNFISGSAQTFILKFPL